MDGVSNVLARSGSCLTRETSLLPILGSLIVDEADLQSMLDSGILIEVLTHEIGHILGFSSYILARKGLIVNPSSDSEVLDTIFTGSNALTKFNSIGGDQYTLGGKVPLENQYGTGSVNGHWRESVFGTELMSSSIAAAGNPLSVATIGLLEDLGYVVDYSAADSFLLPGNNNPTLKLESSDYKAYVFLGNDCITGIRSMIPSSTTMSPAGDAMHFVGTALAFIDIVA